MYDLWLIPVGFLVGSIGTLIGVGGGFIILPMLMFVYPQMPPQTISAISLVAIFFNSISGSLYNLKKSRINFKLGIIFALSSIPSSILGAILSGRLPLNSFKVLLGAILILGGILVFFRPKSNKSYNANQELKISIFKSIVFGMFAGFLSSIVGIGGGIMYVPLMVYVLGIPVLIATATSQFILCFISFSASITHFVQGDISKEFLIAILLCIGTIPGAIIGAKVSTKINTLIIMRIFALAVGIAGIRILMSGLL